jgi:cytidyltransferase-like protein
MPTQSNLPKSPPEHKRESITTTTDESSSDEKDNKFAGGFKYEPKCGNPNLDKSNKAIAAAKADTSGRIYRVFCDGVFDVFHLGHMRMLEQAKTMLGAEKTYLIVGCNSDRQVHKYKGKTVMQDVVRYASVRHCKWVDEIIEESPWVMTQEFLDEHRIDFVAHDALVFVDDYFSLPDSSSL